jgi:hypothetical protein
MAEKALALRLAEYLDLPHIGQHKSAAELRRLHKVIEELLEALKDAARCVQNNYLPDFCGHDWDEVIAKATGEKT